jgi:hypothetical protein
VFGYKDLIHQKKTYSIVPITEGDTKSKLYKMKRKKEKWDPKQRCKIIR